MREHEIQTRLQLAQKMLEEEQFSKGIEFLHSLEPVENYTDRQKARFYTLLSQNYRFLENEPKACKNAEKGMEYAQKNENNIEAFDTFLNMAHSQLDLKKYEESLKLLEDCAEILQKIPPISEQGRNWRIGKIYYFKGSNFYWLRKRALTIEKLLIAVEHLEKGNAPVYLATSYSMLGYSYVHIGEYGKAEHHYAKSQKICEKKESPRYNFPKLANLIGMGSKYYFQGELQCALESFEVGVAMAQKFNNPFYTSLGLNNLGYVHKELGNWDQAINCLEEAMPLAEKSDDITTLVSLLDSFINVYITKGDITAAQQIFQQIEQIRAENKQ
ncbi:MAG: tetratricopeptide repeat protein, partial [Candidatus Heimdallarchaeota archaeon]|nr:tetratricopeptide repeat protein [Candidatus Heimdallarchaeota archaeon]